ncbi:MAG TPA: sulfatase, partial [Porphyromonadaceae bacterium]|nr:sulfatase [Porphyromonadaceae bacterium]
MIKKIALPIKLFLSLLPLLIIQKPLFMLFNHNETKQMSFSDFMDVIWHGLPLDLTVAGYITALPLLMMLVSIFWHTKLFNSILKYYLIVICALLAVIFSVDLELYGFWGFRLDATPLFYLTNP